MRDSNLNVLEENPHIPVIKAKADLVAFLHRVLRKPK